MSSTGLQFHLVDVFATGPFTGNQLCVVHCQDPAVDIPMQLIAAEIAFSETVFLLPEPTAGEVPVRIFTPTREITYAGHPLVGAAAICAIRSPESQGLGEISLRLTDERRVYAEVKTDTAGITVSAIEQPEPRVVWRGSEDDSFALREVLQLDLGSRKPSSPSVVSSGLPILLFELENVDELEGISPSISYEEYLKNTDASLLYLWTKVNDEPLIRSRCFARPLGIIEDFGTGSAAGALGHLLLSLNDYLTIEQGASGSRNSRIEISNREDHSGSPRIFVGGQCRVVAEGHFLI